MCAECRYAQLFAVQPRALCQHPGAFLAGRVLFAGQPSCGDFVPLRGVDVRLGAYAIADHAVVLTHAHAAWASALSTRDGVDLLLTTYRRRA